MSSSRVEEAFGIGKDRRIEDLSVIDIFHGVSNLEKIGYCDARGESISMVIGSTRCGKSTTLNLLLGNQLVSKKEGSGLSAKVAIVKREEDPENKFPVIGNKTTSETTIPVKYELGGKQLWDCPGFGDTRGAQQEIINAWFVNRLFTTASEVKLINLCASTSFVGTDNVSEFLGYIKQIQDVFGRDQLGKVNQILVFTKTDDSYSPEDYKAEALAKIEEHFPKNRELLEFFKKAKVVKIDKVKTEGEELSKETIADLVAMYDSEPYQKMEPHVGVDDNAKVFLHKSIVDISKAAIDNMISAYKLSYEATLKEGIESLFKGACSAKDLPSVLAQFEQIKSKSKEVAESDPIIQRELHTLEEICDFVLKIIPENSNIKDLIDASISACKNYNNSAVTYEVESAFLDYLMASSNSISSKEQFQSEWKKEKQLLEQHKPSLKDLMLSLDEMQEKFAQTNRDLSQAMERGQVAAKAEIVAKYQADLHKAQEDYRKKCEKVAKEIEEAKDAWWNFVPIIGQIATAIIVDNIAGPGALKKITQAGVKVALDFSFADYLGGKDLLGNIKEYFDGELIPGSDS